MDILILNSISYYDDYYFNIEFHYYSQNSLTSLWFFLQIIYLILNISCFVVLLTDLYYINKIIVYLRLFETLQIFACESSKQKNR